MLHYCQTRKFKRVGKKCKTIASKMKHLPRQEQRNNLQRRHHPSCGTPPPPLPPPSPFFPASSDTGAGLFFLPRPTPWWHIAVSCRSRGPPLRPHGTWWRSPRAAAGKGEEPSDETAACIWSGSREREGGEGRRCGSGIRWPGGGGVRLLCFPVRFLGAWVCFGFSPPLLSRDFSPPFRNILLADDHILR